MTIYYDNISFEASHTIHLLANESDRKLWTSKDVHVIIHSVSEYPLGRCCHVSGTWEFLQPLSRDAKAEYTEGHSRKSFDFSGATLKRNRDRPFNGSQISR